MASKLQHFALLTAVSLAAPLCAMAQPAVDAALPAVAPERAKEQQPAAATVLPELQTQQKPVAAMAPAALAEQKPVLKEPDFPYLVSSISLDGWVSGKTRLYENAPAPSLAQPNIESLPFVRLVDADSQHAGILQEFHCLSVVEREHQRGQRRIIVQVFTFPTSDGAYGAYNLLRQGASTVITRGDASSEDDQSISFWKDKYFIHVYGTSEDDEESKDAVRKVADQLSQAVVAHAELPMLISRLPYQDRVRGSEKLVMGPIAARRFFPAPYIASLSLENARAAAVADYQVQYPYPERLKLMCVDYGSSLSASRAYGDYLANLQAGKSSLTPFDAQGGSGSSAALFKIAGTYLLCQLRGEKLVVISGARKRFSPVMLARQLY